MALTVLTLLVPAGGGAQRLMTGALGCGFACKFDCGTDCGVGLGLDCVENKSGPLFETGSTGIGSGEIGWLADVGSAVGDSSRFGSPAGRVGWIDPRRLDRRSAGFNGGCCSIGDAESASYRGCSSEDGGSVLGNKTVGEVDRLVRGSSGAA
jgi:hypothetical protein